MEVNDNLHIWSKNEIVTFDHKGETGIIQTITTKLNVPLSYGMDEIVFTKYEGDKLHILAQSINDVPVDPKNIMGASKKMKNGLFYIQFDENLKLINYEKLPVAPQEY